MSSLLAVNAKDILSVPAAIIIGALFLYAFLRAFAGWLNGHFTLHPTLKKAFLLRDPLSDVTFAPKPATSVLKTLLWVTVAVLASRLVILGIGYGSQVIGAVTSGYPAYGPISSAMNIWNRWDSPHYIDIARDWYVTEEQVTQGDAYLFIVFFPLYPLLMRISAVFTATPTKEFFFFSGCIISNVFLVIGSFFLYRLTENEYGKTSARWALAFLLMSPASLFFGLVYTESLFLCVSVLCLYCLRKRRYLAAGVFGFAAAFTRSPGVLLAVPFVIEWFSQERVFEAVREKRGGWGLRLIKLSPVIIILSGILLYLLINDFYYGNPLQFMKYQEHWGQHFTFFIENLGNIFARIFTYGDFTVTLAIWLPEFCIIIWAMVCLLKGTGKMRSSYLAYIAVYIIIVAAAAWLLSGVRYFAVLFPVYMLMGALATKSDKARTASALMLGGSAVLMVLFTLGYVNGWQIM